MGAVVVALLATIVVGTFLGFGIHWVMHRRWSGRFYRSHMTHHLKCYPPSDLLSEEYRQAGADDGVFIFAPLIAVGVGLFGAGLYALDVPVSVLIPVGVFSVLIGAAHDVLHTAFHLRATPLRRFAWFRRLRQLHFYHHRKMQKNLGIFWFFWDMMFGTLRLPVVATADVTDDALNDVSKHE